MSDKAGKGRSRTKSEAVEIPAKQREIAQVKATDKSVMIWNRITRALSDMGLCIAEFGPDGSVHMIDLSEDTDIEIIAVIDDVLSPAAAIRTKTFASTDHGTLALRIDRVSVPARIEVSSSSFADDAKAFVGPREALMVELVDGRARVSVVARWP